MEYVASNAFSFLQDCVFTIVYSETHTNKWNDFLQDGVCTSSDKGCINEWNMVQNSRFPFLQNCTSTGVNSETYTNKWSMSQKSCFPFGRFCVN